MGKRLLNSEELLRMYKEGGKLQKDLARHFNVTPAAICKKLKRLLPPPKSLENLTEKERRFAIEKAKGKNNTQAALQAYDCGSLESAKVIGSELMDKPEVITAIDDLMDLHGLTKSYRIQRLKQHVENTDPNVSLKGLDMSFKLDGSYAPSKHFIGEISLIEVLTKTHEARKEVEVEINHS